MKQRKKKHLLIDTMPAVPLDEAEIFKWRDRCPPDDDEAAWAALAKLKKRDMNDIAHEGQEAFDAWWNDTSNMVRVSLPRSEDPEQLSAISRSSIVNCLQLIRHYPEMKPPVIHGLLRQGESINIVAPPKVGKTWLILCIAFCIVRGQDLFEKFKCEKGRVLIIDNELHCETIADRMKVMADGFNCLIENEGMDIDYITLRGELVDLISLEEKLKFVLPRHYKVIILDAFYKFFPEDMKENDNAMMTALYNKIDYYAEMLDTAIILVHHSSKGNQSEKGVTDVGAGGGAQSRAADCHFVLREHQNDKTCVVDAEVRSWPKIKSFCIKLDFPIWVLDEKADPTLIKGQKRPGGSKTVKGSGGQAEPENTPTGPAKPVHEAIISKISTPMDIKSIADTAQKAGLRGYGYESLRKHLVDEWLADGLIRMVRPRSGSISATYVRADVSDPVADGDQRLLPEPESFDTEQSDDHTEEPD